MNHQPPGYELRSKVRFRTFQYFPGLFPTELNTFQPSFLRCSHCLFPILGQVMGQEVSGYSKIATEKIKTKPQGSWRLALKWGQRRKEGWNVKSILNTEKNSTIQLLEESGKITHKRVLYLVYSVYFDYSNPSFRSC